MKKKKLKRFSLTSKSDPNLQWRIRSPKRLMMTFSTIDNILPQNQHHTAYYAAKATKSP